MVKQRWYDDGNAILYRVFTIVPSYHRTLTIVPLLFHHRIAFSPSCHRTIVLSPSYHRCFTIVPSLFHHRTIAFSPSYHRASRFRETKKLHMSKRNTVLYRYYIFSDNLKGLLQDVINDEILKLDTEKTLRSLDKLDDNDASFNEDHDVLKQYLQTFVDAERLKTKRLWHGDDNGLHKGTNGTTKSSSTPPSPPSTAPTTTTTIETPIFDFDFPIYKFKFPCWGGWLCKRSTNVDKREKIKNRLRTLQQLLDQDLSQ
ncbi:hypothetical protein ACF0H5_009072 [Mactra antiquata]